MPRPRIELEIIAYQATVIPFNYPGVFGGSGEIRTHERDKPLLVFKTSAISRTLPHFHDTGAPNRIRTDSYDTPFERAAFTNLAIGAIWSTGPDSNRRLYGFADRCIGPLCHLCLLHCRTVTVTETDLSTFFFDSLNHIFKQDWSKVRCLLYADAMITIINNIAI